MIDSEASVIYNGTELGANSSLGQNWDGALDIVTTLINDTYNETLDAVAEIIGAPLTNKTDGSNGILELETGNGTQPNSTCCQKPAKKSRILSDNPGFERMNYWEIYCMLATLSVISLFSILANGLVLFTLFKNKSLRKTKNFYFFVLLAVSLLNSAIYYFYIVLTYSSDDTFTTLSRVCQYFYGPAIEVIFNVSVTLMLGMCVERLVSVIRPLWFNSVWMEEGYTLKLIIGMLVLGILPILIPTMGQWIVYKHSKKWMYCRIVYDYDAIMAYYWTNIGLVYFPCILGVVVVYITVQIKATQARKLSMQFREECKKGRTKTQDDDKFNLDNLKRSLYASRITILLLCVFVGTKLPITILTYAHYFKMKLPFAVRNCEFVGNLSRTFFTVFTPFLFPLLSTPLKNKVVEQLKMTKKIGKSGFFNSFGDSQSNSVHTFTHSTRLAASTRVTNADSQTVPECVV